MFLNELLCTISRRSFCRYSKLMFFLITILFFSSECTAGLVKRECKLVGMEEVIDEAGCELLIVRVNRCSGHCLSFSFPNLRTGKTQVHAKCCRMTDVDWVHTELSCSHGVRHIRIPSAAQCNCFDCAVNS